MNIINIMKLYLKPIFKKIYLSLRYHFGKKFNLIKKQKLNILIITDIKKSISFWHRGRSYFSKKRSHGGSKIILIEKEKKIPQIQVRLLKKKPYQ